MSSNQPSFKLPVGIDKDTGSLLRIDEVSRGLGCNCLCPGCETPLVARKGELKAHHFAHHTPPPESTLSCAESALHKWAKNIVAKQRTWSLRAEHFVPKAWTTRLGETLASHDEWWSPFSDNSFIIENTMEEHDFGDWKPDVLLVGQFRGIETRIAVEIKVSHPVDEAKLRKVQKSDIDLLEIELNPDLMLDGILTEAKLEKEILDHKNQLWLHTPLASRLKSEHDLEFEERIARPVLADHDKKFEEFGQNLTGQDFEVPECRLYDFPDDLHTGTFSFFSDGKSIDLAIGKEIISRRKTYPVARTEVLLDRVRLHLVVNERKEHPIDLILRSVRADTEISRKPLGKTSTLALLVEPKNDPESWLLRDRLKWIFSRRRSKVISDLRTQLNTRLREIKQRERQVEERRYEAATRLTDQIIKLSDFYQHSEPDWSRSHRDRFIEAREIARALGEGPYGGNGLSDRTTHDWIFGVPGQQWKTIVAAEMILRPDIDDLIKFKSLRFFLRKNRLTMHKALSSLWKLEEGPKVFENQTRHLDPTIELPTVGSALHHWLSHLAEVQPNLIMTVGRFNRGFRWISGQRERLLADAKESLESFGH
ncbi:hypothetical protein J057_18950 [Marinobacter nanhaiticus D15-8W]|uniref:Competence protein CoiA n=1 Tax=Marinobacter nanhaiticus D15-8W TaxID=626887 RepID=N6W045_9GAMM|nr:hypothetical protein [Marinobacter nanhaiticus]ENO13504.1 hypothetical protein J057_18950 [Marinobacter nanhaiticus D15-8W]